MSQPVRVLLLTNRPGDSAAIRQELGRAGYRAELTNIPTVDALSDLLVGATCDLLLADHALCGNQLERIVALAQVSPSPPSLVVLADTSRRPDAQAAIRAGAADFLGRDELHRLALVLAHRRRPPDAYHTCQRRDASMGQSECKYRLIFEQLDDAVLLADAQTGIVLEANRQAETLLGRTRNQIIGMHQSQLHPPDDRYRREFRAAVDSELLSQDHDTEILHSDGRIIPISVSTNVLTSQGRRMAVGVFRDVSRRRKIEQALRDSEANYRSLFENSPVPLWLVDFSAVKAHLDGLHAAGVTDFRSYLREHPEVVRHCMVLVRILDVNDQAVRYYQAASKHELLANFGRVVGEWAFNGSVESFAAIAEGQTSCETETRNRTLTGDERSVTLRWSVAPGCEKTFARATVSTIDVTARKQTEEALRQKEEFLRRMIESSGDCIKVLDLQGNLLSMNEQGARLLEISDPSSVINTCWVDFCQDRDAARQAIATATAGGIGTFQTYCPTATGRPKWWDVVITPIRDTDGKPRRLLAISRDITARAQAEVALRQSEERYRSLVNHSPDAIFIHCEEGIVFANPASLRLFGAECPEELLGRHVLDLVHPDSTAAIAEHLRISAEQRIPSPVIEQRCLRLDGSTIDVEASVIPLLYNGRPAVQIIARDITPRRQAERASVHQKELLETIFDHIPVMIALLDAHGNFQLVNRQWEQTLGWSLEELRQRDCYAEEYPNPDYRRQILRFIRASGHGWADFRTVVRDGRVLDTSWATVHLSDGTCISIGQDITARKLAEEALRQSEDKYRTLFQTMAQGVIYIDSQARITSANPAAERMFGLTVAQMLAQPLMDGRWDVIREDGSPFVHEQNPAWLALQTGRRVSHVVMGVFNPQEQQRRWVSVTAVPLFRPREDKPSSVYITFEDITEIRRAQDALRQSEHNYRQLVEQSPFMICRWRPDTTLTFVNTAYARLFDIPAAQLIGQKFINLLPRKGRRPFRQYLARMRKGKSRSNLEHQVQLPNGEFRWHRWTDVPLFDASGRLVEFQSIGEDITETRRALEALRESEERFRRLAENAQDVILRYRLRPTRGLEYVSPAIQLITGFSTQECYNDERIPTEALHPDDRLLVQEYLAGKLPFDRPIVVRPLRKDGTYALIELRSTPIYDEAGRLVAIEGIARDISDRKRAEEALLERASLRELSHRIISSQEEERRRLSRELHDEAGQALTAIKINTELLAKRIPDELPGLKRLARDSTELTTGLISEMRRIAAALRPAVLEDLGLLPTLRWYTKSVEMRYSLRVKLISRGLKGRLEQSFETTVYRIVQEALTNVVRHAKARQAQVRLVYGRSGLDLVISDDGKGMDITSVHKGTGLTGIRERAHLFRGTMTLESKPGAGTTLRVRFSDVPEATPCVRP